VHPTWSTRSARGHSDDGPDLLRLPKVAVLVPRQNGESGKGVVVDAGVERRHYPKPVEVDPFRHRYTVDLLGLKALELRNHRFA
jgi:hypothetical protein